MPRRWNYQEISPNFPLPVGTLASSRWSFLVYGYRPIHSMKFSASSGDQLEYNDSQGASGSG